MEQFQTEIVGTPVLGCPQKTTKRKQHEAMKAEGEKERMRANLLRAVSHDLRPPLPFPASGFFSEKDAKNVACDGRLRIDNPRRKAYTIFI